MVFPASTVTSVYELRSSTSPSASLRLTLSRRESRNAPSSETARTSISYRPTEAVMAGSTSRVRASESPDSRNRLRISIPPNVTNLVSHPSGASTESSTVSSESPVLVTVTGKLMVLPSSSMM